MARGATRWMHECPGLAVQARAAGVEDRLLWLDGPHGAAAVRRSLCGAL